MEPKTVVRPEPDVVARLVARICGDYGERAVTTHAVREHHSHGEGLSDAALPDVVVFPRSNDEVAAIVRLCHLSRVPVIAFGVGTSLEGHVAALYGGVCLDLSQMNRVLEVNAGDLDCRVQAGVTREQLNVELKGTGLFFPIDPGRERHDWRHGVDPRFRDQRGALRDDARERHGSYRRDSGRPRRSAPAAGRASRVRATI